MLSDQLFAGCFVNTSYVITFLRKFLQMQNVTFIYLNGCRLCQWVNESDSKGNPLKIKTKGYPFTVA